MSINTPTTDDIYQAIIVSLEAQFSQTIPLMPKSFMRVLAKVLAGVIVTLYKYAGFMFLQQFVQTATIDETEVLGEPVSPLKFWGNLVGAGDPAPAVQAELDVTVTVLSATTLPSGTQLLGASNGVTYITLGSAAVTPPTDSITVRAVADQQGGDGAGVIGNLQPGDAVSFANPIAGIEREAVVAAQVVTGADGESVAAYRQRIIDRFQKRPQGGAYADYELWGEEVAGIANVYPYTGAPGEVDVYVEATPASSGSPDGIPTPAQLTAVYDAIQLDSGGLATRRPAGSFVNVYPISRTAFDVTVTGLVDVPNVPDAEAAITEAVEQYFTNAEPYIEGVTTPPRNEKLTQSALTAVVSTVVSALGGSFTSVTFELSAAPGALVSYSLGEGEKAKADSVAFV